MVDGCGMVTRDAGLLFDEGVLRRFEAAHLLARRLARGRTRAERRSMAKGAGVEFAEYRPLTPGDDFRQIDWHAFARLRQLVLKLYVEEEDLHVHLLLDCSLSMSLGTPSKFDLARRMAAGLAYIALGDLDRVGFVPVGLPRSFALAPRRGRERFPELLRKLAACPLAEGSAALEEGVRSWLGTRPRRGLAVLVSDCFGRGSGDACDALKRLRHAGHDIAVVQILSPEDTLPPAPGEYELEDVESGRTTRVVVDAAAASAFRNRLATFFETLERGIGEVACPLLRASTAESLGSLLARVLAWV
jgi:uncharacterized protein (DUF58 family)